MTSWKVIIYIDGIRGESRDFSSESEAREFHKSARASAAKQSLVKTDVHLLKSFRDGNSGCDSIVNVEEDEP